MPNSDEWQRAMEDYYQWLEGLAYPDDPDRFHAFVMDNIQESGRFNETENDK